MRWWGPLAAALLAVAAIPATAAGIHPRDPGLKGTYVVPQQVTGLPEIGAWLRRLVGKYRVDGMADVMGRLTSIKGAADCTGIGAGPGVQCILNLPWEDVYEVIQPSAADPGGRAGVFSLPGGDSFLDPAMVLFGLDPARPGIAFLVVDNKGLPEGGSGGIAGTRATFRTPCVNAPALFIAMNPAFRVYERRPDKCSREIRIDARPDAGILNLAMDISINDEVQTRFEFTLRRSR